MIFYDFEVFKGDWLTVILDMDTKTETVIVNDPDKLQDFYSTHKTDIWTGFNNVHYDQYILKGILCGFSPKEINDFIIKENQPGWKFSNLLKSIPLISYDVMLGTDRGLKWFEGSMGNSVIESSVPFDIGRKLTDRELKETIKYCRHDVEQTIEIFLNRVDEFNTKMYFIKHFNFPLSYLSLTKAQLASKILGGNRKGQNFDDEFDFPILDCIQLKKYRHIADWYLKPENHNYSKRQSDVYVAGVPHTFSWGGGHGALTKYHDKGTFIIADVTSYYPSLQERYKFGYRVMDNPENFEFIHNSNIEFKKAGDKKARQPFKIMDNAISGQLKQKTSALYDPMSNNAICVNGQMMLLDLIEHLEGTVDLIQNNTDGILFKVRDYEHDFDVIDDIVYEWEQRTGMKMEFDTFVGEIFQKDVNNYLLIDRETGAMKVKGAYLKKLSNLDYDLPIVNKAMIEYMVNGTPVEKTINECENLKEFQMVKKITHLYEALYYGGGFKVEKRINPATGRLKTFHEWTEGKPIKERCIRVFASRDEEDGTFYKKHAKTEKFEKVDECPEHCFTFNDDVNGVKCPDKLDKEWYVNKAKDRLKGYGIV